MELTNEFHLCYDMFEGYGCTMHPDLDFEPQDFVGMSIEEVDERIYLVSTEFRNLRIELKNAIHYRSYIVYLHGEDCFALDTRFMGSYLTRIAVPKAWYVIADPIDA